MAPLSTILMLPASLLALLSQATAAQLSPTAIRKIAPDPGQKIFPEHLAFAPLPRVSFGEEADEEEDFWPDSNATARFYSRAYAPHYDADGGEGNVLRRAAEALALLRKRASCPAGMNGCDSAGAPDKCCEAGTYCAKVQDESVGHIACCPQGDTCGGGVGKCPSDAVSCPASLGGGCCIPGYVCEGIGCVPTALATATTVTQVQSSTRPVSPQTITTTQTTIVGGNPSTVIVTLTVTETSSEKPTTETKTATVKPSGTGDSSATGGAPYRPISSSTVTAPPETTGPESQSGCPTGFYGCLATHGGGCCRTDRDCHTYSCPTTAATTIVSNGKTIVVPVGDTPPAEATATCAQGWFMCGKDAGPISGCCPTGYDCGTASCFTVEATHTGRVQKELPKDDFAGERLRASGVAWCGVVAALLAAVVL